MAPINMWWRTGCSSRRTATSGAPGAPTSGFSSRGRARRGGVEIAEVVVDRNGEPVGEPTVLRRGSAAEPSGLVAVGDAVAFALDEVQDDVFVAALSAAGDALARPFARATQSDSREA